MSANNIILVRENKKNFKIVMLDTDTNIQLGKAKKAYTLREAVEKAQAMCDWESVEYGIQFDLREIEEL